MTLRTEAPAGGFAVGVVVVCASLWGLFWIPLRYFEQAGLAAGWATFFQFAAPAVVMAPFAMRRIFLRHPTGLRRLGVGMLIGSSFVLYFESLLLTEVVRSLLLFYITPIWGTLLEVTVLRRRFHPLRGIALLMGFSGLYVILHTDAGLPLPRNLGDCMALAAGMIWALGTLKIRRDKAPPIFEHLFATFFYGACFAALIIFLPIDNIGTRPDAAVLAALWPALLALAIVFLIPIMWGLLWGAERLDPGQLGIFLQMEAVVGIGSAALLSGEPFGNKEILGTALVIGAGVVDVLGQRTHGVR